MSAEAGNSFSVARPPRTANLREILGGLVFTLGLMPWVSFGLNSFDSQPYTMVMGLAYLCASRSIKSDPAIIAMCLLLTFGLCVAVLINPPTDLFLTSRGIYGYLTLAVALLVAYDYIRRYGIPLKIIVYVNYAYLFFAFLDLFAPDISSLISSSRTTVGRGVTSLAAEPSFFAIYLYFSSWLLLIAYDYRPPVSKVLLLSMNLFALVFLARSALGVLLFSMTLAVSIVYLVLKFRLKTLVVLGVALVIIAAFSINLLQYLDGSRLAHLTRIVTSAAATATLLADASFNTRLQSIIIPTVAAIKQFPTPGGFETYREIVISSRGSFGDLFLTRGEGNRISSWTGAMMYELGAFGIATLFVIAFARTKQRFLLLLERFLLLTIAINAIPTNFPPIAFLVVFMFRPWSTIRSVVQFKSDSHEDSPPCRKSN